MMVKTLVFAGIAGVMILGSAALIMERHARAADLALLDTTIAEVKDRWPDVAHITAGEMEAIRANTAAVLFDTRTPEEFAVSHIAGAIRLDPGISAPEFVATHGAALKGKTAVFYCSVGVRSSKVAERVKTDVVAVGGAGVANLEGGIFGWHRDRRPMVDGRGETPRVHPFDKTWGKAVSRPQDISTQERK